MMKKDKKNFSVSKGDCRINAMYIERNTKIFG